MAAHTSLLLVIALCAATAYALQCYTCSSETSNTNCLTPANCSSGDTYCQTSVVSVSVAGISTASITKRCTSSCTPSSGGFAVASTSVSCCSTDLCNTSGGVSIKSSCAAIILALGFILTILKSSIL